jgi:hypothetical protein
LIGAVLIDNHRSLKRAWAANPNAATLSYLPVTEAELEQAEDKMDDARFKSKTLSKWKKGARDKFGG